MHVRSIVPSRDTGAGLIAFVALLLISLPSAAQTTSLASDNNVSANWCEASKAKFSTGDFGTPGAANDCGAVIVIPTISKIDDIQGAGDVSPVLGSEVTIEGIVTAGFHNMPAGGNGGAAANGFFVQEQDPDADAGPLTSEGIFVYEGSSAVDVAVGDKVRVTGLVTEFHGLTELSPITSVVVAEAGAGLPAGTNVELPVAATFEAAFGKSQRFTVVANHFKSKGDSGLAAT